MTEDDERLLVKHAHASAVCARCVGLLAHLDLGGWRGRWFCGGRDGQNLHYDLYISFTDAALGCNPEIETIESKVKVKLDAGIQSGKILRLRGKGLPSVDRYGSGDLLIHVNVWTPQDLNEEQTKFFESNKDNENFQANPDGNNKSFFDKVKEMFR